MTFVAVDLGAGSGRVFLAGLRDDDRRWDARRIFDEVRAALAAAAVRARALGRPVESVGVDSWGVDYGLVDGDGRLIDDSCQASSTPSSPTRRRRSW